MPFSIIIPSRNADNLRPCVQAVLRCEPSAKIVVIDDGARAGAPDLPVSWLDGVRPFVFARNVNIGIRAVGDDDVVILNDDALLESVGGFTALSQVSQGWGVVSAANNCGNSCQRSQGGSEVRPVPTNAPSFICVYIPRATIGKVGVLDERFTAYGFDDNDYVHRTRLAGLKVGVYDRCFVDHKTLHSTFRGKAGAAGDITEGRKIFEAKWGVNVH